MSRLWSQFTANPGLELAVAGTLLVFTVLILVSLYITLLPKFLRLVGPLLDRLDGVEARENESEAVAVAVARHAHMNGTER